MAEEKKDDGLKMPEMPKIDLPSKMPESFE